MLSTEHLTVPFSGAVIFAALTWLLGSNTGATLKTERYLNPPPEHIEHFHFGFSESMADSLWLRWIQDGDVCQTYLAPVKYGTTLGPHDNPRHKVCDTSWSFKMLDAVTRLAPKFWMPYVAGGSTLAVIVEDYEGATKLYERGLKEYPDDWILLYRASYHYQFDVGDKIKAAELLVRAGERGGPFWLRSLAARLQSEAGQYELALRNLLDHRKGIEAQASPEALKILDKRINEVKAKLEKAGP